MTAIDVSYATAPPSVGNMAVGFDILGHALAASGDQVRATRMSEPGVTMGQVSGCVSELPSNAARNTAGAGVQALLAAQAAEFGVRIDLHKSVALGSGMGGSASSAVASVMAANQLLDTPLPVAELMPYALAGERVASGCIHGDNVAPALIGGLVFICPREPARWFSLPVPDGLSCVLVRPHLRLDTSAGRSLLSEHVTLRDAVTQTSMLSQLFGACYGNRVDALEGVLSDSLVEPQRCHQVDGFADMKAAALDAGALGMSLSGSGPAMVAWSRERDIERLGRAMQTCADRHYPKGYEYLVSTVDAPGARVMTEEAWLGD